MRGVISIPGFILLVMVLVLLAGFAIGFELMLAEPAPQSDPPAYHLAAVLDNLSDPSRAALTDGLEAAADRHDAVIEISGPRFGSPDGLLRSFEMAVLSKVDGIIIQAAAAGSMEHVFARAAAYGLPVVTLEDDSDAGYRVAFVGPDDAAAGKLAAELAAEALGGKGRIQIFVPRNDDGTILRAIGLRRDGALAALRAGGGFEAGVTEFRRQGIFGAENATRELVLARTPVEAIICLSAGDTLGVAQLVVDLNRVGRIAVIGYGDQEEIQNYVDKAVIQIGRAHV